MNIQKFRIYVMFGIESFFALVSQASRSKMDGFTRIKGLASDAVETKF